MENGTAKILVETIVTQNEQLLETTKRMFEEQLKTRQDLAHIKADIAVINATMVTTESCVTNQSKCPHKGLPTYTALLAGIIICLLSTGLTLAATKIWG